VGTAHLSAGHSMNRRNFLIQTALALAGLGLSAGLRGPKSLPAAPSPLTFAFLADAHLKDGGPGRPEALALARAVAEIKALKPRPHLVLFAGDLAHDANPEALALGEEILSDLPMPVLAVRGEGDGRPQKGGAGRRLFQSGRFLYAYEGLNLLGVDTSWQDTPEGPAFALGETQRRWLEGVLAGLDPDQPLLVLSHAPLIPLFRPWGQWTVDSGPLLTYLSHFENVLCLHGHVHQADWVLTEGLLPHGQTPPSAAVWRWGKGDKTSYPGSSPARFTPSPTLPHRGGESAAAAWRGVRTISLPATSWPLPSPLAGTPCNLRPGRGPRGCGWTWLPWGGGVFGVRQMLWQA